MMLSRGMAAGRQFMGCDASMFIFLLLLLLLLDFQTRGVCAFYFFNITLSTGQRDGGKTGIDQRFSTYILFFLDFSI